MSSVAVFALFILCTPVFLFTANILHILSGAQVAFLTLLASLCFSLPGLASCVYFLVGGTSSEAKFLGIMYLFLGSGTTLLAAVLYVIGMVHSEKWPTYPDFIGFLMAVGAIVLV